MKSGRDHQTEVVLGRPVEYAILVCIFAWMLLFEPAAVAAQRFISCDNEDAIAIGVNHPACLSQIERASLGDFGVPKGTRRRSLITQRDLGVRWARRMPASAPSTMAERVFAGILGGALVAAGARLLNDYDSPTAEFALYSMGSAGGVMFATASREGARPMATLAGTAVGFLAGVAVGEAILKYRGDIVGKLLRGIVFLISVPLGGAVGHGYGQN